MDNSGLREAVEATHACRAVWRETTRVVETWEGETVWEGDVAVFDLTGHPSASVAYVWESKPGEITAVLQVTPVKTAADAVRASLVAWYREERDD